MSQQLGTSISVLLFYALSLPLRLAPSGSSRLHALPGITPWSKRHRKSTMGAAVGQALAKSARRIKSAIGKGVGFGSKFVGVGKEIGREVQADVRERGVEGFLEGTIFSRKPSNK